MVLSSILTSLVPNSTQIVENSPSRNLSLVRRKRSDDLPTPESPTTTYLNMYWYAIATTETICTSKMLPTHFVVGVQDVCSLCRFVVVRWYSTASVRRPGSSGACSKVVGVALCSTSLVRVVPRARNPPPKAPFPSRDSTQLVSIPFFCSAVPTEQLPFIPEKICVFLVIHPSRPDFASIMQGLVL